MNKLIIISGAPCEKQIDFIKKHKLEQYTISIDTMKLMFDAPQMSERGYEIPQRDNKLVFECLHNILEQRMKKGAFTVVNGAHTQEKDFTKYKMLCKKYRYKMIVVPFIFNDEEIEAMEFNNTSKDSFLKMNEQVKSLNTTFGATVTPEEFGDAIKYYPIDLSRYKKVNHIGDIHGCFTALSNILPIKDDEFYIFLGDYFDRGIENAKVAKWLFQTYEKPNVVFLKGNHELHLEDYLCENEIKSSDFEKTLSEFENKKIKKKDLKAFFASLYNVFLYKYDNKVVLCSHGGTSFYPENINFIDPMQFVRGVGNFASDVDKIFSAPENVFQVHGHRNITRLPITAGPQSFNLNDEIEYGGYLRVLTLSKEGFSNMKYKNTVFSQRDIEADKKIFDSLSSDEYIKVKNFGDISSINFSRKAFYDKRWNERTLMARGLFVNNKNYNVVCRGYEKFFNVDEVPSTTLNALKKISFPVTAYLKENGYLGLLGVDEITESLVFASKSSVESDYAMVLESMIKETLPEEMLDKLRLELLMRNNCLVFEVIEPEFDPHIIEYPKKQLVLLDIIDKDYKFKKQPYPQVISFAKRYGFQYKRKAKTIHSYDALVKFLEETKSYDFKFDGTEVEGFVLEDSEGFQFKVKCGYYNFWKAVRRITQENGNIDKALSHMDEKQQKMLKEVINMYEPDMTLFDLRRKFEAK